jgi:hypothetical protein
MSIVSASFVGSALIDGVSAATNVPYNIVQLNGHTTVDKLRVLDYAMTTAELDALDISDIYTWDANTLLYAEFINNLNAGSIVTVDPIESWNIVRFISGSTAPTVIASDLDAAITNYTDYTAVRPNTYYYRIFPITASAVLAFIQSNTVEMCYDYFAFLDPTTGDSFTFKLNIDSVGKTLNASCGLYEGFTQYPAKYQGVQRYNTIPFSALLGNVVSNVYTGDTVTMYDAFEGFITNGNLKYFKDRKGHIYKGDLQNLTSNMDQKPVELPVTINFEFVQLGAV